MKVSSLQSAWRKSGGLWLWDWSSGWVLNMQSRSFLDIRTENRSGWTGSAFNIIPEVQVGGVRALLEDFFGRWESSAYIEKQHIF